MKSKIRGWAVQAYHEKDKKSVVFKSLMEGKARIGWSREDRDNLRTLAKKRKQKKSFTSGESDAWRGNHFFLGVDPEDVQNGDLLFYRKQPTDGRVTVVQVTGSYGYLPVRDDFRSYRPCRVLVEGRSLNMFPPKLRERLKKPGRFSRIANDSAVRSFYRALNKLPPEKFISNLERQLGDKIMAAQKTPANGKGAPGGVTPEQFRRGVEGEEFILTKLRGKNGWNGLKLSENGDRRKESCGYDFLCKRIGDDKYIEVEVKTFAKNGRIFLTQKEWSEARTAGNRYCLVGVRAIGRSKKKWVADSLPNPYPHLLEADCKVMTVLTYFVSADTVFPKP